MTTAPQSIAAQLTRLLAQGLPRLDAQLLLLHALGRQEHGRAWLTSHDTELLAPEATLRLEQSARRRLAGEPLAYITGHKEFFGLDLQVDARVLVPRPDTEILVEWALELLPQESAATLADLGCGSGAIALALKSARPLARITGVDLSRDALAVARANAQRLQLAVDFLHGSWLASLAGRLDLIVSNPPYIAAADPHLAALVHEPLGALASGPDGLDDLRAIITQAPAHLARGGWLLLEHGHDQAAAVRSLLQQAGWQQVQSRRDLAGIERCSGGIRPD